MPLTWYCTALRHPSILNFIFRLSMTCPNISEIIIFFWLNMKLESWCDQNLNKFNLIFSRSNLDTNICMNIFIFDNESYTIYFPGWLRLMGLMNEVMCPKGKWAIGSAIGRAGRGAYFFWKNRSAPTFGTLKCGNGTDFHAVWT